MQADRRITADGARRVAVIVTVAAGLALTACGASLAASAPVRDRPPTNPALASRTVAHPGSDGGTALTPDGGGARLLDTFYKVPVPLQPAPPGAIIRSSVIRTAGIVRLSSVPPRSAGGLPATLSATVIRDVIRGRIGYRGLLLSDDLAMQALTGTPAERATRALAAGCDVALYCPGDAAGNEAVLAVCPQLDPAGLERIVAAKRLAQSRRLALDPVLLQRERDGILG